MMLLLSCYIENYGTLSQKSIDFQSGLNVFCEENGYGKSTLVSFLKAMLYGLPSYKKTTKDFTERQHFYPFNGGKFGGYLVFSHEGKTYRVERVFDKKSETKDECRIFCDSVETKEFGEKGEGLGRALFQLDEDSFKRTVFVEKLSDEFSMTTDIGVALNRLVDDTDDDRNFERAQNALSDYRKKLHTDRANRGLIPELKEEIHDIADAIARYKNVHKNELESRYEEKKDARRHTEEAGFALAGAVKRTAWNSYDEKINELSRKKEELERLKNEYPNGIPTEDELKRLRGHFTELLESIALAKQGKGDAEKKRLDELSSTFTHGVPTQEELEAFECDVREKERLAVEIHTVTESLRIDEAALNDSPFQGKAPSEDELSEMADALKRYRESEMLLHSSHPSKENTFSSKKAILSSLGGVVLLCGLFSFAASFALAIVLSLFGFLAAVFFGASYFVERKKYASETESKRLFLQKKTESLRQKLIRFLSAYDYPSDIDLFIACAHFQKDVEQYRIACEKREKTQRLLDEKKTRLYEIVGKLKQAFRLYEICISSDERQNLTLLRDCVQEYARLSSSVLEMQAKRKEADAQSKKLIDLIARIFTPYGISVDPSTLTHEFIDKLSFSASKQAELRQSILALQESAEKYRTDNGLDERPDMSGELSLDVYQEEQKQAQMRESELDSRIRELESELEELPELENELARKQELLESYTKAYKTVKLTESFLKKAEQNLHDRYVAPVYGSFLAYASELESTLGENVSMDKEFRIQLERGGELRSDKHLSAGQYAVSALCMRLALAEQIYGENLPFLILDDPFVHLDATHIEKALATVRAISEKTQILYFTCHPSRAF